MGRVAGDVSGHYSDMWGEGRVQQSVKRAEISAGYFERAAAYYHATDWDDYPDHHEPIVAAWALSGMPPAEIAEMLGRSRNSVQGVLRTHKCHAGLNGKE